MLLILSLLGCAHEPAPDLLDLHRIDPPTLEEGSELRVEGMGFAEHRSGTLTLVGTLYAPGRTPRSVRWTTAIEPETHSLVAIRLDERHINEILEGAHHGTFVGHVEVEFAPIMEGRPILRGELEQVTLNVFSAVHPLGSDAAKFASYLGLSLSSNHEIEHLDPKGIAAQSGLELGDRLLSLDGVHLDSFADFVPAPHMTTSVVSYLERGAQDAIETQLPRADFQLLDVALSMNGLAFALGVGLSLVMIARPPRFVVWMASVRHRGPRPSLKWLAGVSRRGQVLGYLSFALVAAGYFLLTSGVFALEHFDFLLSLTGGVVLLLISAFLLGGVSGSGRFSLLGAFGSTTTALLITIPIIIAALCRSADVGSLHLAEVDGAQSVWGTQIGALQAPWSLLLSIGYLLALIPIAGRRPPVFAQMEQTHRVLLIGRTLDWVFDPPGIVDELVLRCASRADSCLGFDACFGLHL